MNATYPVMPSHHLEKYLKLLGVEKREPSFDALCELVQAHLCKIPFENISKLYYKKHLGLRRLPHLELYLDGIERFHFGGTCYTNNYYFLQLLANLGYTAKLCGADMSNPDVHLVSVVTVDKQEYLVDVGYAAPFISPMPRDWSTDYVIESGRDRYVLKPQDDNGRSRMELFRDGELRHGYLVKPAPRQIEEFDHIIVDSLRESATFMNAVLLAGFCSNHSLLIHNLTLISSQGTDSHFQTLANQDELVAVIFDSFGIPGEITKDALSNIKQLGNAWT